MGYKKYGLVPVGGIIAWVKSFANTPILPDGFVECNGQTLNDSESPFDGQDIPLLNGTDESDKLFLRGATTSGATGGTDTHCHYLCVYYDCFDLSYGDTYITCYVDYYTTTEYHIPPCYEVVWVMRVK